MRAQAAGRNLKALTAVVLAILSPRLLGAEAKPLIGVELRIEAPNFRSNLSQHIDDIQRELSQLVADLSADRHEFLTWQALKDVQDHSQLSAILHVSLTQEADGVMLRFSAEAGRAGARFECPEGAVRPVSFVSLRDLDRQLFSPLEPQPGKAVLLRERIQTVLKGTGFRDALGGVFASRIPVCHVAEPRQQGLVAIGLKQSDLNMEEGSTLEIDLCSLDQGTKLGALLRLDAAIRTGIYPEGPKADLIQGRVSSCIFGGFENDSCKSRIRPMFEKVLGAPDVFVIDFRRRYSCTQGSQALCPGKG